ncbi:MAG: glycosyltransferase family 4 protein [Thermodesulfobacteriota bacterium]|nr:glycosyltransferase family 4 protein [Thermodesulfobacteriota bacterium]
MNQMKNNTKVRVAFLTNIIPHYRVSFYEKLAQEKDIELLVIHGVDDADTSRPGISSGESLPFETATVRNRQMKFGLFTIRWQNDSFKLCRNYCPDIIILLGISGTATNWLIGIWARIRGKKVLMWTCGWEGQQRQTFAYRVKRFFMRQYFAIPHCLLVYSNKAKHYMEEIGVQSQRIDTCYNGLDIELMQQHEEDIVKKAALLRQTATEEDHVVFLYVGGMNCHKRVDLLLSAFAFVKKQEQRAHLWLVGDGQDLCILKAMVKETQLEDVYFWGRVVKDVDVFFAAADIFVLPGIGGLALNQAMFWRTPCICSEADGTEDDLIVDNVTGYRFMKGDEHNLSEIMLKACHQRRSKEEKELVEKAYELLRARSNVNTMVKTFHNHIMHFHAT